ncbi:MAG: CotH kinase family protein [Bacteroidales bacterium]|nr:CotH kinase family protein [Bacteroidales bacterium]
MEQKYFHKYLLLFFLYIFTSNVYCQDNFYDINTVREIRIEFEEDNWDEILDSLFLNGNDRLLGKVIIDGTELDSVGIRYKGYSSCDLGRPKNPFNIKLDYIIDNQSYSGINKIKLSNAIDDPSFLREVLSYEIIRKYMPASEANFANVYVNDELQGLYTNVESVNKDFTFKHFSSRENTFIKGEPEELEFPFGKNANLEYCHGIDSLDYIPYYKLESDYGWSNLFELIQILNETPENIEQTLNVNRTLWMHATNYVLANLDSYIAYSQNYYLYLDNNNRFNPIIWDLNMSFGSFRNSDAINYFGLSINQVKELDPLQHLNSSHRPLISNLIQNETYRKMFLANMLTILDENFSNDEYKIRCLAIQNLINIHVQNDTNKFYSYEDFLNNLESEVGGTGGMGVFPGIVDLMEARLEYLMNFTGFQSAPNISIVTHLPANPISGETISITSEVENANSVTLFFRPDNFGLFQKIEMFDDGNHNDGNAGDNVYGATVQAGKNNSEYYIYAENEIAGKFSPRRAEYELYKITNSYFETGLVINEFLADNESIIPDQNGEFDDWIELYNNRDTEIELKDYFLSDLNNDLTLWAFPDTSIKPNDYLIIWADNDEQSGLHANFQLSLSGDEIYLINSDTIIIDGIEFGSQSQDTSTGRFPNGTGEFIIMPTTFSAENFVFEGVDEFYNSLVVNVFPNPAREKVFIAIENIGNDSFELQLMNIEGCILYSKNIPKNNNSSLKQIEEIDISNFSKGIYIIKIQNNKLLFTKKILILS